MQTRISATIAPNLQIFMSDLAKNLNTTRSKILEKALLLLQKKVVQEKIKQGYLEDKEESLEFAHQAEKITTFNENL